MRHDPGFAPAKINLALHVTGRRADGYHLLDSLVAFADIGDRVTWTPGEGLGLTASGPFAADVPLDGRNLILKAAQLTGASGQFHLEKFLPAAGGIGGGSSDAAAALRLVGYEGDGLTLGADLPICRIARAARMSGIGEAVTPLPLPPLPAVLVNPGVHVSTPSVFAALEHRDNPDLGDIPAFADPEALIDWLAQTRNDLEPLARHLEPVIGSVLDALAGSGAALARMSGSGATCFGLFETRDQAALAAQMIATLQDEWWVQATVLS